VRQKISHIITEQVAESASQIDLHPITKIHLYALNGGGLISYVYIFSVLALFVLLIACINFMNLTTARSTTRAKEIGMRKVIGAYKTDLVKQFLGESILFSFIALILALSLVELFLPEFNNLTDKQLSLDFSGNWLIYLGLCGITLFTGIVSGSYPALFLSSFQPVKVFGGTLISGEKASLLRRILVVAQFTLSIFLISGSLAVSGQLDYMGSKELGYDKENILCMDMRGELRRHYQAFKNELLKNSRILSITRANTTPVYRESGAAGYEVSWEGKQTNDNFTGIKVMGVDTDYIKTFNIEMAEGRFFSESFPADQDESFVINETAAKAMGLASPVGKRFSVWDYNGKIIGVIKDFHFASLHYEIEPLVMKMGWALDNICIRIKPDDIPNTIHFIEDKLKEIIPDYPFEYEFLDESLNRRYRAEQRMETLSKYMTALAIFISCLGLFGLAAFTAERRTKEISIRKVFGASVSALVFLLSKEYIKWVIAANVIAWPVARVVINSWLQNFAYRIDVDILPFLTAGALALVIALLTVSFQAIKAALSNPVEALRYE
jgi:ABC-type antimicrobial peptide transport system permease subunit